MQYENNIIRRPKETTLYDNALSLGHILIDSLTKAGDKTVIIWGLTGQTFSGNEVLHKSINVSKALLAAGIKRGDIISVVSESCLDYVFVLFGTIFINCTLSPLNHTYSTRELKHALDFSKPKFIFTGGSATETVTKTVNELNYVEKIICFDGPPSTESKLTINFNDFVNSKNVQNVQFTPMPVSVSSTRCMIMCSSGTTGLPKGVQLSQTGVISTISIMRQYLSIQSEIEGKEPVVLGLLPLFHVFGSLVLISTIANDTGKIVLLPRFEEKSFFKSFEKYRISVAFLVPPLLVFLAKGERVDEHDLSSLKLIVCGAAPVSKELELSVTNRLKTGIAIKQLYGMTELTSTVLTQKDIKKPGSVGDLNEDIYAKVVDENGAALGPNQPGELCFKGCLLMMGYVSDTAATNAIIDKEGWLHTGDIGYYDEDFQFFIVDRIKELIKFKGFQVPPAEIEAVLLSHPKIKDCGVVGKPDEFSGELPVAFVVKGDANLTESDVVKFVYDKVSPAKRLHGGVIFINEIPKNPSGKILRRELRRLLAEGNFQSKL
ncbi:Luciferin 4-monooxygenase [Pseudolycoriella hygida]|uniref:Luciferin 4-monooxygenase n=1 Tax=Pseudolycoriella hygida TaxID=35572 RepID=A0A9Q0RVT6_9DIPT|nr:Luciferin 4-monooxygenase [Pseudolycoriella hygida]